MKIHFRSYIYVTRYCLYIIFITLDVCVLSLMTWSLEIGPWSL